MAVVWFDEPEISIELCYCWDFVRNENWQFGVEVAVRLMCGI